MRRMTDSLRFACETARARALKVGGLTLNALEWGEPGQPGALLPARRLGPRALVRGVVAAFADATIWSRSTSGATGPATGHPARLRDGGLRGRSRRRGGRPRLAAHDRARRPLDGRAQRDGLRSLASGAARRPSSSSTAGRPCRETGSGPDAPAWPPGVPAAPRGPRDGARELPALAARDGGGAGAAGAHGPPGHHPARRPLPVPLRSAVQWRRRPTDGWALLERIAAPTLLVRGEHSPILPPAMAQDMLPRFPTSESWRSPGVSPSRAGCPRPFAAVLDAFLSEPTAAA